MVFYTSRFFHFIFFIFFIFLIIFIINFFVLLSNLYVAKLFILIIFDYDLYCIKTRMDKTINMLFEMLQLKAKKHEWRRRIGIDKPDSLAEHSLLAAQIWYILAKMEWADANKIAAILIWHDSPETRIWDIDRIWWAYISGKKEIEKRVVQDQFWDIEFGQDIIALINSHHNYSTLEWQIARDADLLELCFQAKMYIDTGYTQAQNWIDNVSRVLQTDSAKKMLEHIQKTSFTNRRRKAGLKNKDLSRIDEEILGAKN